jgi:hypothetical protein
MLKRKADLSVNVIIVAALALVVFVVLAAIFTNKTRDFSSTLSSCTSKQGQCLASCEGGSMIGNTDCEKEKPGTSCCVKVFD